MYNLIIFIHENSLGGLELNKFCKFCKVRGINLYKINRYP